MKLHGTLKLNCIVILGDMVSTREVYLRLQLALMNILVVYSGNKHAGDM